MFEICLAAGLPGGGNTAAIFHGLIWLAFGLINYWIWSKNKAKSNMLMMIGGGTLGVAYIVMTQCNYSAYFVFFWWPMLSSATIVVGFFLASQSLIQGQLAAVKAKVNALADRFEDDDDKKSDDAEAKKDEGDAS